MDKILEIINEKSENKFSDLILNEFNVYVYNKQVVITFFMHSDRYDEKYNDAYYDELSSLVRDIIPEKYKIRLAVKKTFDDDDIVHASVLEFLRENYPSVSAKITRGSVKVKHSKYYDVIVSAPSYIFNILNGEEFKEKLIKWLSRRFVAEFEITVVETEEGEKPYSESDGEADTVIYVPKVIEISEVQEFIGAPISKYPRYISESHRDISDAIICGKISGLSKKISAKGNTFYTFTLTDPTGAIRCMYFPRSEKGAKMDALNNAEDVEVVVSGSVKRDTKFDSCTFWMQKMSFCKINWQTPLNDVVFKGEPGSYRTVYPEAYSEIEQGNLFEGKRAVPHAMQNKTYVVFDLETTGKDVARCEIIEIAAIKVVDGECTESFSTFVKPKERVSEEITKLTTITQEDVDFAPLPEAVMADFYKFTRGAILVGHNAVGFDIPILKRVGRDACYNFDNPVEDTYLIARKYTKGSANYKLGTLCEFYGISLVNAHRAIGDVAATAKLFKILAENL